MSTFVIAIVPDETKAYQAVHALEGLHTESSITLYDTIVVQRRPDGTLETKERSPLGPAAAGIGALLGGMLGLFGGPPGVVVGASAGAALGGGGAFVHGELSDELLEDISKKMKPGDFAVLAEVSEQWTAPIDTRMGELGAIVLREQRSAVADQLIEKRAEAHRAAVEQRKVERASRKANREETKLEVDLTDARWRLERIADKAAKRLDVTRRELEQKLDALDEQAKKAGPATRAQIEQHIAEIRKDFGEREQMLTHALDIAQQALQP
jgi:uncharacterized membrane protein